MKSFLILTLGITLWIPAMAEEKGSGLKGSTCEKFIDKSPQAKKLHDLESAFNFDFNHTVAANRDLCTAKKKLNQQKNNPTLIKDFNDINGLTQSYVNTLDNYKKTFPAMFKGTRSEVANIKGSGACVDFLHEQEPRIKTLADGQRAEYTKSLNCQ